jgi:hypothetical protein
MKLKIVLQNGWMGDTLLACNVIRNLSDLGHEVVVFHNWPFMKKFIDLFEIIQNPTDMDLSDYKEINYTQRIDHFANPLTDYALNFGFEDDYASKFYSVEPNLRKTYEKYNHGRPYITFDHDWQLRTNLNVDLIIDKLMDHIDLIPVGGDRFTDDPDPLVISGMVLIDSKLHLGMVGGTTNLAAFTNTKINNFKCELCNIYIGATNKSLSNHKRYCKHKIILDENSTDDNSSEKSLNKNSPDIKLNEESNKKVSIKNKKK